MNSWTTQACREISRRSVQHPTYERTIYRLFQSVAVALPGEIIVLVGPSRVGKTRAIEEAIAQAIGANQAPETKPSIRVVADNMSTSGQFSTKAFCRQMLQALEHPIHGLSAGDDNAAIKRDQQFHRTPEGMLHDAIERALHNQKTRFVIIDEVQHVKYARGGLRAAAAILDSWKCLAQKTGIVLILVGSYELLDYLAYVPHLLGRMHLVEFPPYDASNRTDQKSFASVLKAWSLPIRFERNDISLLTWGKPLMEGSLGCVGQLGLWLRKALGSLEPGAPYLTREALLDQRQAAMHAQAIEDEILRGGLLIAYPSQTTDRPASTPTSRKRKPFQRASQRFKIGGRK